VRKHLSTTLHVVRTGPGNQKKEKNNYWNYSWRHRRYYYNGELLLFLHEGKTDPCQDSFGDHGDESQWLGEKTPEAEEGKLAFLAQTVKRVAVEKSEKKKRKQRTYRSSKNEYTQNFRYKKAKVGN
jgi:hypothetical protein